MSDSLWPHRLQHARLPCPSSSPRVCSNSYPLSQWCCLTVSSSVASFSFCLQSFPPSGKDHQGLFQWVFTSSGQSIEALALVSVLPMNILGWFPLRLTGIWSLCSPKQWSVFSSTTIQKHQFFGTQPSLWSNSHIHTWLLKKP